MKVYGMAKTRTDRVVWCLKELGLDFEVEEMDLGQGDHLKPEFLKLNPNGKVPVLVDGDTVIYESAAICLYLADKKPKKRLVPKDATEKAHCMQWLFFVCTELEAPLWNRARHSFIYPEEKRIPDIFPACDYEFRTRVKTAEKALEGREFIVGDKFTVADIFLSGVLAWGGTHGLLDDCPNCKAYAEKMHARKAYPKVKSAV